VIEHKYYENLEHLRNTTNETFYLTAGNLPDGTTKKDLLKFFSDKGIDTSQIMIMMKKQAGSPIAELEIYLRNTAVNTLKCCGEYYAEKQMIIEVNDENEKYYLGGSNDYHKEEYEDPYEDIYTKYDNYPIENKSDSKKIENINENPTKSVSKDEKAATETHQTVAEAK